MTCRECKHWDVSKGQWPDARVKEMAEYGRCRVLQWSVDITIQAGWEGGYVDYIETEHDFFCKYFEKGE